ncbi:MAG: hypothetical protein WCJ24_01400 [Candidatus Saccharibacteria bacterium]
MADEPQSLKEIIEQRLQSPPKPKYHHIILDSALAGFLFALILLIILLIKSIR